MLQNPKAYTSQFEKMFNINEIPVYKKEKTENRVILENGYVQSKIVNPNEWTLKGNKIIVTQIDIIFTKYPKNKEFWLTNYYELLANRISDLLKIDSTLNSDNFEWNLVLQTNCNTETEAKSMFHGIAITYFEEEDILEKPEKDETPMQDSNYFVSHTLKVQNYIRSMGGPGDSIIYKIFDRNRDWKNALVVMDWTGSMYQYGSQAVLWHTLNFKTSGIRNFVFFNDGDEKADSKKELGNTGGIYYAQANNLDRLINTFYLVGQRGKGGDEPENDLEALLKGMNRYQDFDELILIADNSCIRDYSLLINLDVKVNVIMCGIQSEINPQYINLAYLTGGSLHTIDEDIKHMSSMIHDDEIVINHNTYKLVDEENFVFKKPPTPGFVNCEEFTSLNIPIPEQKLDFSEKNGGISDSTVMKVLDRHPLWMNSVVVMDWSKEMYTNSAQAILWHKLHRTKSGIEHFYFCNDGNKLPLSKKKNGKTGGIYYCKANNFSQVIRKTESVTKRGNGGMDQSNNMVESLIESAARQQKAEHLILIADNNSCLRDLNLVQYLNMPVKIILCNIDDQPINPQYLNLALLTGGSLHLINDDIYNYVLRSTIDTKQVLTIGKTRYIVNKNGLFEFEDKELQKKLPCTKFDKPGFLEKLKAIF